MPYMFYILGAYFLPGFVHSAKQETVNAWRWYL